MKKIVVFSPNLRDATSFYRAAGPFSCIKRQDLLIDIPKQNIEWWDLTSADIVFIHRPFLDEHLAAIEIAKALNCRIWLDFDDNLWTIPESNPCKERYGADELACATAAIKMADIVTTSTDAISEYIASAFDVRCRTIPNAWNDYALPFNPQRRDADNLFWRGSNTHDEDLESVFDDLRQIADTFPRWGFIFAGQVPYKLKNVMPAGRFSVVKPQRIEHYMPNLAKINASLAMVPLVDNEFNRGKSNIAWLEATYAGMATIAPDMTEWQRDGVTTYGGGKSFYQAFCEAEARRSALFEQSASVVASTLLLSQVNKLRLEVINDLA